MANVESEIDRQAFASPSGVLPVLLVAASASMLFWFHRFYLTNEWIPAKLDGVFGRFTWAASATTEVYLSFLKIVICAAPFVVCEVLLDRSKTRKLKALALYLFPIGVWTVSLIFSCLSIYLGVQIRRVFGVVPYLDRYNLSFGVQVILWVLIVDFLSYVFHRLEHSVPVLWRIHSTHHSIENLNSINQYSHWFESMFRLFMIVLPIATLVATPPLELTVFASVYAVWSSYTHCDRVEARLPKWAAYFLIDNVCHRYHHGRSERFHQSNYGNMFTVWDHLFRTRSVPVGNEFPRPAWTFCRPPGTCGLTSPMVLHPIADISMCFPGIYR